MKTKASALRALAVQGIGILDWARAILVDLRDILEDYERIVKAMQQHRGAISWDEILEIVSRSNLLLAERLRLYQPHRLSLGRIWLKVLDGPDWALFNFHRDWIAGYLAESFGIVWKIRIQRVERDEPSPELGKLIMNE
jgi:hypothetical protein